MNVAYVFATAGQTVHSVLGGMIPPQLEAGRHGGPRRLNRTRPAPGVAPS
jgi:hypothetical protein